MLTSEEAEALQSGNNPPTSTTLPGGLRPDMTGPAPGPNSNPTYQVATGSQLPPANQQAGGPLPPFSGTGYHHPGPAGGYSQPPLPDPNQPVRYQTAPNGEPYVVKDHPEAFLPYKNTDGKQVYASYAILRARIFAAMIDTLLLYIPLQIVAWLVVIMTTSAIQQKLAQATSRFSQDELGQDINNAMPAWLSLALLTVFMLYCLLMTWRGKGQTLGKRILRIKVIRLDGSPPDFQTALTRNLFGYSWGLGGLFFQYGSAGATVGFILQLMVLIGFSAAIYDKQKRGWHDRLADTLVVGKQEIVQGINY